MKRRDWISILIIGAGVGLLIQPILTTTPFADKVTLLIRAAVFFGFVIFAPLALWIAWLIGKWLPVAYQFAKFAAVGALNSFVDLGVLNLELLAVGNPGAWTYRIIKGISFLAATTNSFLWNKFWTFNSRDRTNPKETISFYAVAFIGFLLNVALASYVFTNISRPESISRSLWANIAALVGVAAAFIWNFVGYKYIVFKEHGTAQQA